MALIWGRYISSADNVSETIFPSLVLILIFFLLNYVTGLMNRYVGLNGGEDIEQLSYVQANRQQELLQSRIYAKISSVSAEYLEIAKINDNISQVLNFSGERWGGASREVMLQSYAVIAKIVSVVSIALSLYIFNPWLCLIAVAAPHIEIGTSSSWTSLPATSIPWLKPISSKSISPSRRIRRLYS